VRQLPLIIAAVLVAGCGSGHGETVAIKDAVRAPLRAYMNRQAAALCASFTPAVASRLSPHISSCPAAATRAFYALRNTGEHYARRETPEGLEIAVTQRGDAAEAQTTWPWQRPARLRLAKVGGRWLIASKTTLVERVRRIRVLGERRCDPTYEIEFGAVPARVVESPHSRAIEETEP
jgi:hypothetical protein